jgi:hypothetical protein
VAHANEAHRAQLRPCTRRDLMKRDGSVRASGASSHLPAPTPIPNPAGGDPGQQKRRAIGACRCGLASITAPHDACLPPPFPLPFLLCVPCMCRYSTVACTTRRICSLCCSDEQRRGGNDGSIGRAGPGKAIMRGDHYCREIDLCSSGEAGFGTVEFDLFKQSLPTHMTDIQTQTGRASSIYLLLSSQLPSTHALLLLFELWSASTRTKPGRQGNATTAENVYDAVRSLVQSDRLPCFP